MLPYPNLRYMNKSSYQKINEIIRYHLVVPNVPREGLRMQDLACCDYFPTPVIFDGPDNLVFGRYHYAYNFAKKGEPI